MLRTFCSNPALGGFGSESSSSLELHDTEAAATPDAFCQIIKELVDNAVDACIVSVSTTEAEGSTKEQSTAKEHGTTSAARAAAKRVRVVIERFEENRLRANSKDGAETREILRVTVSDNGCGMKDIQSCVGAFHSSKAHNITASNHGRDAPQHLRVGRHDALLIRQDHEYVGFDKVTDQTGQRCGPRLQGAEHERRLVENAHTTCIVHTVILASHQAVGLPHTVSIGRGPIIP